MNNRIISLKFDKKDFEEIYFRDNRASLFFSPTTKGKTITIIFSALILCFVYFDDWVGVGNVGICFILSFILFFTSLNLILNILNIVKYKKETTDYLKSMIVYKVFELQLGDDFLYVKLDEDESFTSWDVFKNIQINNQFVALEGKTNFLFPRKSMNLDDYNYLKDSVKKILAQKNQSK